MIIFPTMYVVERGLYYLASLLCGVLGSKRFTIDKNILLATLVTLSLIAFYFVIGEVRGNKTLSMIPLYLIWPIFFTLAIHFRITREDLVSFERIVILSTLLGAGLVGVGVFSIITSDKGFFFQHIYPVQVGFIYGLPKIGSQFLPILCFSIPFTLISLLTKSGLTRVMYVIALLAMLTLAILSGRSVFIFLIMMLPFFLALYFVFTEEKINMGNYGLLFFASSVLLFLGFNFIEYLKVIIDILYEKIVGADNEVINSGRRFEQFQNIMAEIKTRPLGSGVNAPEYQGSDVVAFEVTYLQIVHNFGIIFGAILFFVNLFGFIWVWRFFRSKRKFNVIAPWLFGYMSYLICAASNPILLKFDRLWILWIPLFFYVNRRYLINDR